MGNNEQQVDWLEEAIKLEATPKTLRQETIREFCARLGVPESSYYYHISKADNKKKILEVVLTKAKDRAPAVLEKLVDEAEKGDMKAMAIYMDSILRLAKQLDITTGDKPIPLLGNVLTNNSSQEGSKAE